jgi:DNA-binding transcriptional regulator PaaX
MHVPSEMHYNELKLLILRIFSDQGLMDSLTVAAALRAAGVEVEMHAVRMALMRYYKQGLLSRQRKSGMYVYGLSDRGVRRLEWLESVSQRKHASGAN